MTAKIARLSDHAPKHRRVPSSLPAPQFPGSDVISDPTPAELAWALSADLVTDMEACVLSRQDRAAEDFCRRMLARAAHRGRVVLNPATP